MRSHENERQRGALLLHASEVDPSRILSLGDAAALVASRPGVATLHRWISRGVRGHRLKSVLIGGRRMIRLEDLEQFLLDLNGEEPAEATVENDNSSLVDSLLGRNGNINKKR